MKKVLMPLSPQECERVFNGEQTVLVRKRVPKCDTPFEVLVYCTKARELYYVGKLGFCNDTLYTLPTGELKIGDGLELMGDWSGKYNSDNFLNRKVIGSFVCDGIIDVYVPLSKQAAPLDKEIVERDACLSLSEIQKYAGNKMFLRGLHITKPKLFDKPKELSEFRVVCHRTIHCRACEYVEVVWHEDEQCFYYECRRPSIIRPPQSFCYVEDVC